MTEESTNAPEEASGSPVAGQRLAKARLAREISIHDIAKELHLDEPKVRAIEQNEFEILGAPVFAKGYLRKYAELVGISADDVLADYHRIDRSTGTPPLIGTRPKPPRDIALGPWLAALLLLAVLAAGVWIWLSGGVDRLLEARRPAARAPLPAADTPREREPPPAPAVDDAHDGRAAPLTREAPPEGTEPTPASAVAEPEPEVAEAPAPTASAASDEVELALLFSGDCWTEVSDANGERLYFGLGTAGRSVSVSGTAPLYVLLGDSQHATVTVDGAAYPIPAAARRGDTARLTIARRDGPT